MVSRDTGKIAYAKFWRTNKKYNGIFDTVYLIFVHSYALMHDGLCNAETCLSINFQN